MNLMGFVEKRKKDAKNISKNCQNTLLCLVFSVKMFCSVNCGTLLQVVFTAVPNEKPTMDITIVNDWTKSVIFKMKTTQPEAFKMRPVFGEVKPDSKVNKADYLLLYSAILQIAFILVLFNCKRRETIISNI